MAAFLLLLNEHDGRMRNNYFSQNKKTGTTVEEKMSRKSKVLAFNTDGQSLP